MSQVEGTGAHAWDKYGMLTWLCLHAVCTRSLLACAAAPLGRIPQTATLLRRLQVACSRASPCRAAGGCPSKEAPAHRQTTRCHRGLQAFAGEKARGCHSAHSAQHSAHLAQRRLAQVTAHAQRPWATVQSSGCQPHSRLSAHLTPRRARRW